MSQHIKKLRKDFAERIDIALTAVYHQALDDLLNAVEKGKIGNIDYKWDGKKVIRDNIIFSREELVNFFRFKFYGKPSHKTGKIEVKK